MRSLIDPDTALALVIEHSEPTEAVLTPLQDAAGLTVAQSILADADYPPFDRSMMDGYAVHIADAGKSIPVRGEVAAGAARVEDLPPGTAFEIMTGAPCPQSTEAVVPKEDVGIRAAEIQLPDEIRPGQNIIWRGQECKAETAVVRAGEILSPLGVACCATFGLERVNVYRRPSLAIITTGNELVSTGDTPGPAQIRNSNGAMLCALAASLRIVPVVVTHAVDTTEELAAALAMAERADVIILTGAVSAGKYDLVPEAIAAFGATPVFHKVLQRPGKPLFFATRGQQQMFGLPGNPLSCFLGFHRYVAAAIRKRMHQTAVPPQVHGVLHEDFVMKGPRTVFQLAFAANHDGVWQVTPLLGKGSADMYTVATANAMVRFEPGSGTVKAGTPIAFDWLLRA